MKLLTSLVLLAAAIASSGACEQRASRLDKVSSNRPSEAAAGGATAPAAGGATAPAAAQDKADGAGAAAGPGGLKIDRTGSVEQQLARLQDAYDRSAEVLDVLNKQWAQQKAQQAAQERDQPAPDAMFAVNVADDIKAGQVDGPATAPVTIIKVFDFACPYCQRVSSTMEELVKEYGGKVRVVYANMVVHPVAKPAHLASCAAAKQGKYMQFKDAFWDKGFGPYSASQGRDPASLGEDNIMTIAKDVGLDPAKLKTDMASPECSQRLDKDMQEMTKFHVSATPSFFINGKFIDGARGKDEFKALIDEQLKKVEQSGVSGADYYNKVVLAKGEKQFRSKTDPRPN
jgi:protein-disulfide isomerase